MRNWHHTLIAQFKNVSLYLLLPVLLLILFLRLVDGFRAPDLPSDIATQALHTIDGQDLTLADLSEKSPCWSGSGTAGAVPVRTRSPF